jgi:hypothetical protein
MRWPRSLVGSSRGGGTFIFSVCRFLAVISLVGLNGCSPVDVGIPIDFGVFKGEITKYSVMCEVELVAGDCPRGMGLPLNPTTYAIYLEQQMVTGTTAGFVSKYTDCAIGDRKNWSCLWEPGGAKFGFTDGRFFDFSEPSDDFKEWKRVIHVSRSEYPAHSRAFVGVKRSQGSASANK